jgi:hypothetical protein
MTFWSMTNTLRRGGGARFYGRRAQMSERALLPSPRICANAAKCGALSTPHGRVEVNWNRGPGEDAANLSIAWREIGGPAVPASHDCRYGVSIIRDLIPQELGGSVDLAFASSGVCCNIEIPLEPARPRHTGLSADDARSREALQP